MKVHSSTPQSLQSPTSKKLIKGLTIGIALSRFNDSIGNELYENTVKTLLKYGVQKKNIQTVRVPGALELPLAAKWLISGSKKSAKPHAIIALGVVIRGATYHFEMVCQESHRGLMDVQLQTGVPVIIGVITAENAAQAKERASADKAKRGLNKGQEFAQGALEMAMLRKQLS